MRPLTQSPQACSPTNFLAPPQHSRTRKINNTINEGHNKNATPTCLDHTANHDVALVHVSPVRASNRKQHTGFMSPQPTPATIRKRSGTAKVNQPIDCTQIGLTSDHTTCVLAEKFQANLSHMLCLVTPLSILNSPPILTQGSHGKPRTETDASHTLPHIQTWRVTGFGTTPELKQSKTLSLESL